MGTKKFKPYVAIVDDIVVDISNSFSKLTEYKKEELIGQNIYHLLTNILRINAQISTLEDILNNKLYFIFNKQRKYRDVYITPYREADICYLAFNEFPNSRIQDKLPYLSQQIQDNFYGVALFSAEDLTLLMANEKYKEIIGKRFGQTDIVGKRIYDFVYKWDECPTKKAWMQVISTGNAYKVYEFRTINPLTMKEEYVDRSITPLMIDGAVKYLVIMLNDVTEKVLYRKQNEEQRKLIEQQKEQLETIIEQMSDAVFIIDKNGKHIIENKAAKAYAGSRFESLNETYEAVSFHELDGTVIPLDQTPKYLMMHGKTVLDRKMRIKAPGREVYVSVSATPIFDNDGNFLMGILSSRDVTEYMTHNETIKEQQRLLLEAEKKEKENLEKIINMKDEFLSLISHEFKTPLTVINSALQAMEFICSNELSPKAHTFLDKIRQNTYRQLRLVNNLLDITRANAGHIKLIMRNLDIVFVARSIVESVKIYAQQKGVYIDLISDFEQKIIAIDEEKFERILLNLLSNAIKFTPENKHITVRISESNNMLRLEIIDEGVGIPIEKQQIIFERFGQVDNSFARQAEGSGIGLYLVKLLVDALDGNMSLNSTVGQGSTFTIEIPAKTIDEHEQADVSTELIDSRFVQAIAIEFSDIYF